MSGYPSPVPQAIGQRRDQRLAFVLAGGGSGGAYQVGALRALTEAGIVPELVVGTSAGALNAVAFAADPTTAGIDRLADSWSRVRRSDIFPVRPASVLAVAGRSDHLVSNAGLRRWIEANLDLRDLEDASLAVHVVATDLETGKPVVISEGRALTALLASSAVPGLLPPVRLGGLSLVDGGVAADTPILQAVALGATEVVVLSSFQAGGFRGRDPRPAGLVWYAYEQVLAHWTVDHLGSDLGPGVVAYPVPLPDRDGRGPLDFSAGSQRIADAYRVTKEWLHLDSVELLHRPAVATARPLQLRSRRST